MPRSIVPAGAVLAVCLTTGSALAQGNESRPAAATTPLEGSGFDLVVLGSIPGLPQDAFALAVAEALPTELVDPQANFTRDAAYRAGDSYRLVMLFHRDGVVDPTSLCAREAEVKADPPAPPEDLAASTQVTAAFCRAEEVLSRAKDKMVGSIEPGQAGFRFLVSDVAKQLFPNGFGAVPGTISSPAEPVAANP